MAWPGIDRVIMPNGRIITVCLPHQMVTYGKCCLDFSLEAEKDDENYLDEMRRTMTTNSLASTSTLTSLGVSASTRLRTADTAVLGKLLRADLGDLQPPSACGLLGSKTWTKMRMKTRTTMICRP